MATCLRLVVIRHAEKPDPITSIGGVTEAGTPNKDELTARGWQRAGALVRLFNPWPAESIRAGLSVPGAVFAAPPTDDNPSKRPLHTVTPLAADLQTSVRTDFALHQEKELVEAALAAASCVLVCWHHERIGKVAAELGISIGNWPDEVFDRVLVFDRSGAGWAMETVPERLLPGDK